MHPRVEPLGVILAGGLGRRIGGAKATVELQGKPLICYPLEAMQRAVRETVIIAKADTELPSLPAVTVWVEPDGLRHPLVGIVHALGLADGRPALVCASDLPFVTVEVLGALARADSGTAPAVVACSGGETQPLLGCYQQAALQRLRGFESGVAMRVAVAGLDPRLLEIEDPELLFNVNTPDDL